MTWLCVMECVSGRSTDDVSEFIGEKLLQVSLTPCHAPIHAAKLTSQPWLLCCRAGRCWPRPARRARCRC